MAGWQYLALAVGVVALLAIYCLCYELYHAPVRDDWPHDDSLGG